MVRQKKKKDAPRTGTFQTQENPAELANRLIAAGGTQSREFKELDKQTRSQPVQTVAPTTPQPTSQLRPEELAKTKPTFKSNALAKLDNLTDRAVNVAETVNAAFNPFSKKTVEANFGSPIVNRAVEAVANHPFQTALALTGITSAVNAVKATTAVSKAAQVGTINTISTNTLTGGTAATIATNTATTAKTASWLGRAASTLKNPQFVVGSLMASIGSYPFAGFIKEEALQTLGFATKAALDNDDIAGAEEALALQDEVLDPGMWEQIKQGIPFVNVLSSLDSFYEAAKIKNSVDRKIIEDRKIQVATGETDDERWARVREEQAQQERDNIDYYNQERKKLLQWENEAAAQQREEEAAFWRKEREKQRKLEEEDRKAIADFWEAYRKEAQKATEAARPSKLNFGLL